MLYVVQYLMLYLNSNLDYLSKPNPDSNLNSDARYDSDARSDSDANVPSQLGLLLPGSILDPHP